MVNLWHAKLQESLDDKASGELRITAIELLELGADRAELVSSIQRLIQREQAAGNDRNEVMLLELLDYFHGWCRPDLRI